MSFQELNENSFPDKIDGSVYDCPQKYPPAVIVETHSKLSVIRNKFEPRDTEEICNYILVVNKMHREAEAENTKYTDRVDPVGPDFLTEWFRHTKGNGGEQVLVVAEPEQSRRFEA